MLRPIDPAPYAKALAGAGALADLGAVPMLQWVPIAQLRVDPAYQRDITAKSQRNVGAIARDFSWRKFAPVVVAAIEGGLFAIIDGQHRTTAAALRGAESVPCLVVVADVAQQAAAFAAINGRVTVLSGVSIFHARVASGEVEAVELQRVCAAADVNILTHNRKSADMQPGDTIAPKVLEAALRRHGSALLITALQCVTQTGDGNAGLLGRPVIEAMCSVLAGAPPWCEAGGRLLDVMDDFDFRQELAEARIANSRGGQTVVAALIERLTAFLNEKLGLPGQSAAE